MSAATDARTPVSLKDYTPPAWWVETTALTIALHEEETLVTAQLALRRNSAFPVAPFVLDGEELETLSVRVNGIDAPFESTDTTLTLTDIPDTCILETTVRIFPNQNTRLSGLYRSKNGYFTQCEPQGFRRITWFPDRPDVMSVFTVTLEADRTTYPVLLSNGNPLDSGDATGNRHWVRWHDPFKKPAYLFAAVAGKLDVLRDTFTTLSGRTVQLAIYVEPGKLDQCGHAMAALKKSMQWDEKRFGLECDLDHYMIVAVSDFNMGAMENKGLNIFNTKYVLARADIATDTDFENIDRVVAHEYFHNWTGNRVTCRDWFQLSLKEGLTVFRDQSFGADVHERSIARIRDVRALRAQQFPEDAGPMAHPIRPDTYLEINNFYTATVYEKGAEVIRMMETLVGPEAFRRGIDEYFRRHDGQAVRCEDFVAALSAATGFPFEENFIRWYTTPGTPHVRVERFFDPDKKEYTLTFTQSNPKAETINPENPPALIPISMALFDPSGACVPGSERVLAVSMSKQSFQFVGLETEPVPSLLRHFSAPIVLDMDDTPAQQLHLLAHETDPFSAWEAGQRLSSHLILEATAAIASGKTPVWPDALADVIGQWLKPEFLLHPKGPRNPAWIAEVLTLPGEGTLAEALDTPLDPEALHQARNSLRRHWAEHLADAFSAAYDALATTGPYTPDTVSAGRRALRNVCLNYRLELDTPEDRANALTQFKTASNMTDQFAALAALVNIQSPDCAERTEALSAFLAQWQHEALVVDKWLAVQAGCRRTDTLETVKALTQHPAFDVGNPNKVYALIRTFGGNLPRFHAADGAGYRFIAEFIQVIDPKNPQVAARLARCFDRWKHLEAGRQVHAKTALITLHDHPRLSRDVQEIVEKALQ